MANMKIVERIHIETKKGRKTYYTLNDGTVIDENEAINAIISKKIYGASVVHKNGRNSVRGDYAIPTRYERDKRPKYKEFSYKEYNDTNVNSKEDDIVFERDMYKKLVDWKNNHKSVSLFLQGPRQVGKTYLLRQFAEKEFSRNLYINLKRDDIKEKIEWLYNKASENKVLNTESDYKNFWFNVFKNYDSSFENKETTLLIIDEIQESPLMYNSIREMNRYLNCRVCLSGSYLAVTTYSSIYSDSAGDLLVEKMNSLNFCEFLKAMSVYDKYSKVIEISKNKLSDKDIEVYKQVEKLYNIYILIGGYPAVVKEYLLTKDVDSAVLVLDRLLNDYFSESERYLTGVLEKVYLPEVTCLMAEDIITHKNNLSARYVPYILGRSFNKFSFKKEEKENSLGWLVKSNVLSPILVINNFNTSDSIKKYKFYFNDIGILSFFCKNYLDIPLSDIKGSLAENFVYLFLRDNLTLLNHRSYIDSRSIINFESPESEIDFLIKYNNMRIGIEVKYNSGGVKSSDKELELGNIDWIIKIMNTYGGEVGKKTTIPIFAIDKMFLYPPFKR